MYHRPRKVESVSRETSGGGATSPLAIDDQTVASATRQLVLHHLRLLQWTACAGLLDSTFAPPHRNGQSSRCQEPLGKNDEVTQPPDGARYDDVPGSSTTPRQMLDPFLDDLGIAEAAGAHRLAKEVRLLAARLDQRHASPITRDRQRDTRKPGTAPEIGNSHSRLNEPAERKGVENVRAHDFLGSRGARQ